jgi:hypothetical protein
VLQGGQKCIPFNVSSAGAALTIDWTNDYGEGAVSVLTRNDGQNWPDLN